MTIMTQMTQEGIEKAIVLANGIAGKIGIDTSDNSRYDVESLAVETYYDAHMRFAQDGAASFNTYLYTCMSNAIKSELTRNNALKRGAGEVAISLEVPVYGKDGTMMGTLGDITPSGQDVEAEVIDCIAETENNSPANKYLASLNRNQRKIAAMLLGGATNKDIMASTGMSKRQFNRELDAMRSYERYQILVAEM